MFNYFNYGYASINKARLLTLFNNVSLETHVTKYLPENIINNRGLWSLITTVYIDDTIILIKYLYNNVNAILEPFPVTSASYTELLY